MVWLKLEVWQWELISGFRKFKDFVKSLTVVNDPAERGVKLIQDFVNQTSDKTLRQDLLLAVSDHREKNPANKLNKELLSKIV